MSKEKKKLNPKIVISIIVVLAICVFLFFYVFNLSKSGDIIKINNERESKSKQIKDANSRIIDQAKNQTIKKIRPISKSDHIWGKLGAPIEFIIYDDFDNEFSVDFHKVVKKVKDYFGDEVAVAFRHYPMRSHQGAFLAALSVECAAEQGKFLEMRDKIFLDKEENKISAEQFKQDAKDLKLNSDQFNECMENEKYKDKIQAQLDEAFNFNIIGVPSSFINSRPIPGAHQFENFKDSGGQDREGLKTIIEKMLKDNN